MREHYFRLEAAGQQKLEHFIASRLTRREQMNRFRTAFDDFVLYSMADFGVPPAFRLDEVAAPFVQPYSDVVDELWNLQKVRSPFDKVKHLGSNLSTCTVHVRFFHQSMHQIHCCVLLQRKSARWLLTVPLNSGASRDLKGNVQLCEYDLMNVETRYSNFYTLHCNTDVLDSASSLPVS